VDDFIRQTIADGDAKIVESAFHETQNEGADLSSLRIGGEIGSASALSDADLAMLYLVLVKRYGMLSYSEAQA
jgi:hypothetical protein